MNHLVVEGLSIAVVLTVSAFAQAQEPEAAEKPPAAEEKAPAEAAAPAATAATGGAADGVRFRFGVAGGIGFFSAASEVGPGKVSCTYYGSDLRFGAQVNNLIGVYAQPTLGYYSVNGSGGLAAGGLLGVSVVADATSSTGSSLERASVTPSTTTPGGSLQSCALVVIP